MKNKENIINGINEKLNYYLDKINHDDFYQDIIKYTYNLYVVKQKDELYNSYILRSAILLIEEELRKDKSLSFEVFELNNFEIMHIKKYCSTSDITLSPYLGALLGYELGGLVMNHGEYLFASLGAISTKEINKINHDNKEKIINLIKYYFDIQLVKNLENLK